MTSPETLATAELFEQYTTALRELRARDVLRTSNHPAGDYAEWLAHRALGGSLAPPSEKSFDLTTADGTRVQVKARTVSPRIRPGQLQAGIFRSWDFNQAVFVQFAETDYRVVKASLVPKEQVRQSAKWTKHDKGWRVFMTPALMSASGSVDITDAMIAAAQMTSADIDRQQRLQDVEPAEQSDQTGKYIVTTPDGNSPPLPKRRAMLALVHAMSQEMSCDEIQRLLTPSTFVRVGDTLDGDALWDALSVEFDFSTDKRGLRFVDAPIHQDGATWVLAANVWGPSTGARMQKIVRAGSGLIAVRRSDEDQVA